MCKILLIGGRKLEGICIKVISRLKRKEWLHASGVRACRTFFQTLSAGFIGVITIADADWKLALSTALMASIISIVNSLGGIPEVVEE
jgi:hypothetical protein